MFEQTFVDGVGKTRKPYTILLSFAVQLVAVFIIVIIPLIYFDALPTAQFATLLTAPPPPPPPQTVKVVKVAPKQFDMGKLTAPKTVPKEIKMIVESEEPPSAAGVVGGIPGGVAGGALSGILGGTAIAPPPPPPPPKPKPPQAPVRIGGNVQQANLIRQPKPIYPPLAKAARVQGTVKFEAKISKEGSIEDLHLVSGPPLLVQAAMDAVKQWQYKPTLLNGEPVEVITTIDVNFTLSQ